MHRGAQVSHHRHVDREVTYVLEGALRDGEGVRFGPGHAIDMPPGSEHSLHVDGEEQALVALLHGAVEMLG
jgi:anti-sigma factor ChrR (cupin superfamily)